MMNFIREIIAANCITQFLLLFLFYKNPAFFDSLYTIHQNQTTYFWYVIIAVLAIVWLIWTVITYVFGIRRLGLRAETASRNART